SRFQRASVSFVSRMPWTSTRSLTFTPWASAALAGQFRSGIQTFDFVPASGRWTAGLSHFSDQTEGTEMTRKIIGGLLLGSLLLAAPAVAFAADHGDTHMDLTFK